MKKQKSIAEMHCPLFTNNARKMAGYPVRRKSTSGKRYRSRCESWEAVSAWYDWISAK